jgi:chromosome segregation ATPase
MNNALEQLKKLRENERKILLKRKEEMQLNINNYERALANDLEQLKNIKTDIKRLHKDIERYTIHIKEIDKKLKE